MLRDLFDFSRRRTLAEASVFYLFYVGCFIILAIAFGFDV